MFIFLGGSMKRFDFGDDIPEDDSNDDGFNLKDELLSAQQEQTDILKLDVDEKILNDAISLASKDWFWFFRSSKKKLEVIAKTYRSLKKIIDKN
jgi:hypothetical protein